MTLLDLTIVVSRLLDDLHQRGSSSEPHYIALRITFVFIHRGRSCSTLQAQRVSFLVIVILATERLRLAPGTSRTTDLVILFTATITAGSSPSDIPSASATTSAAPAPTVVIVVLAVVVLAFIVDERVITLWKFSSFGCL